MRALASLTLFSIAAVPGLAEAQIVNVLEQISDSGEDGFSASLGGTVTWRTGNTNLAQARAQGVVAYRWQERDVYLIVSQAYGAKGDGPTNKLRDVFVNNVLEHVRYRQRWLDQLGFEVFFQHEFDAIRRLKTRALVGLGPRLSWSPSDALEGVIGTAYMPEYQHLNTGWFDQKRGDLDAIDLAANDPRIDHRWSSYLQLGFRLDESGSVSLHTTTFVQPRITRLDDVRLLSEGAIVLKANEAVAVKIAFRLAWDNRPVFQVVVDEDGRRSSDPLEELDTLLGTTLTLSI